MKGKEEEGRKQGKERKGKRREYCQRQAQWPMIKEDATN